MIIKCGVDLVYLPRFKKSLKSGGENFLRRVFLGQELDHLRGVPQAQHHLGGEISHLAGIFAAKEAVIKALSLPTDSWHDIFIIHKPDGQPKVEIINHKSSIINHSLSISHDGNYCFAQFIAMLKE